MECQITEIPLNTWSKYFMAFNPVHSKNMKWIAYGNYLWFDWQLNGGIVIDLEIQSQLQ